MNHGNSIICFGLAIRRVVHSDIFDPDSPRGRVENIGMLYSLRASVHSVATNLRMKP